MNATKTHTSKLAIYAEHCVRAGKVAADDAAIDEYRLANDGQDCGDWVVYEGTKRELLDTARHMLDAANWGALGQHRRRSALSIIDAIGAREDVLIDDDIRRLGALTTRDEAGRHFTDTEDLDWLHVMESLGMIEIDRPIHHATGIPYGQEHWSMEMTDDARDVIEAHPELF